MTRSRLVLLAAAVAFAVTAAAPPARADRRTSIRIYKRGKRLYQRHHYAAAIKAFKKAYDEHAAPAYLYNIAQAYRELGRCSDARFFYKQFAAQTHSAKYRAVARRKIHSLKSKCGQGATAKAGGGATAAGVGAKSAAGGEGTPAGAAAKGGGGEPPAAEKSTDRDAVGAATPKAAAPAAATAGGAGAASDAGPPHDAARRTPPPASGGAARRGVRLAPPPGRSGIVAVAEGGAAFHDIGAVVVPVTPMLRAGVGYGMALGRVRIAALAAAELSPMSYQKMVGDGSALFANLLAELDASVPVGHRLRIGGGVGAGLLVISGLEDGNPFTAGGAAATVTSLAARVGLTAQYRLTSRLAIAITPALSYAPGGGSLAADIGSITRFEVLAGVRYRQ